MEIKYYPDLGEYTLTSTLKKEEYDLVKKYRPAALKQQDDDGNDVFAISFVDGKSCVASNGVTFGSVNAAGFLMIKKPIPELPHGTSYADYIADEIGGVFGHVTELEAVIPAVVSQIVEERSALKSAITTA